jgi:hypothetical protein
VIEEMEEEKRVEFLLRYIDILGNVPNGTYFNTINQISSELNKALGVNQPKDSFSIDKQGNMNITGTVFHGAHLSM